MTGAKQLKSVCFKCGINKWAVDFKEGRYSELSSTSVCLSCEQSAMVETHKREIDRLKTMDKEKEERIKKLEEQNKEVGIRLRKLEEYISKLEKPVLKDEEQKQVGSEAADLGKPGNDLDVVDRKVEELRKIVMENRDEIVETGRQVVEIREECASSKNNTNFRLVKGRKSPKVKVKEQGIALTNQFAVLEDEVDGTEVEAFIIGDSIVGGQNKHFASKNKRRRVKCYRGGKAKQIVDEITRLKVPNKDTCIIANAGSNDLYLRGNEVGSTEPLVRDLKNLVDSVAEKTNTGILVGIMPRAYASYYAMSKAIGINERVSKYCSQKAVQFIDIWKIFVGKWHYFKQDGIHLNEAGNRKLGEILCEEHNKMKNKGNLSQRTCELLPAPAQVSRESEDNTFEGFSKEN